MVNISLSHLAVEKKHNAILVDMLQETELLITGI